MKGRLFLIHWNQGEAEEHAKRLKAAGWDVELETEDGARGGNAVKMNPPNALVIYLTRLPSHGRETAHYLKETKSTRAIPIVFVGGKEDAVKQTKAKVPDALYIQEDELMDVLEKYAEN